MSVLSSVQRKELERAVGQGRVLAESAARVAVGRLGVADKVVAAHLCEDERVLRRALRARARQLGDRLELETAEVNAKPCGLLIAEVAYEQWHRLLFARFLEINGLLMHPKFEAPVSISECEELAADLGEPDGWSVAARFASEIVPGVFRPSDPCAQIRLAREDLLALERVVTGLPPEVFLAEDALGWVYQYWQSQAKREVQDSGRKIGGADISPVTQLFTEHYMVRFLLENSLGAWWAGRYPDSPLVENYQYLRRLENGFPAAGSFEEWPSSSAEVTMMDPCCGSGHFLVASFGMLWRMRAEEECLIPRDAQDAVLRDNIFGLELDPRCAQIAVFALTLEAWKQGGYRQLPVPNVASSGMPAKAPLTAWTSLAGGDDRVEAALARLHALFRNADTLGSLIDPISASEQAGLESVEWQDISPLFMGWSTVGGSTGTDPEVSVFGEAVSEVLRAARYLSRSYTLVVTNVPYLGRGQQSEQLREFLVREHPGEAADLATAMSARWIRSCQTWAFVQPHNWLFMPQYEAVRESWLDETTWRLLARLGSGAFRSISGQVVQPVLWIASSQIQAGEYGELDCSEAATIDAKAGLLVSGLLQSVSQSAQRAHTKSVIMPAADSRVMRLSESAGVRAGLSTGDAPVFIRFFWEVESMGASWQPIRSAPASTGNTGCQLAILWENESGKLAEWANSMSHLNHAVQNWRKGKPFWGRRGVAVKMMGELTVAPYFGERFDASVAVIVPKNESDYDALWAFAVDGELARSVRAFNKKVSIESGSLLNAGFDVGFWRKAAIDRSVRFPHPASNDPTQWLFRGLPVDCEQALQVAVARLLGFRWPDQEPDALDELVDEDGIVCLPAVAGERTAADRVREVLSRSFGDQWSGSVLDQLLVAAAGKQGDLARWLADGFFKDHCKVFQNRPFIWHVWDGRKDGFSALINYHRLTRSNLQRLTYTTLGWWIDRQKADADSGVVGADLRLSAAMELQLKLEQILEGEPPFDVFVRWKPVHEQPLGWNPDLDDGVRLNVRPFVEAGVLRSKFTVQWKKDRGTNPDGSERHNDVHMLLAEKRAARGNA